MEILRAEKICKTYPSFTLQEVSFSLEQGEILGFIGRNGAGKTTTLKALLGFIHADAGQVRFFGRDFCGNEAWIKQQLGFVSGGFRYYAGKKLKTITKVTRSFYPEWDQKTYQDCLRRFGLDEQKTPSQLSEGMKVKYALTLALSHRASVLILDEPTSGLDPVSREEILDIFLDLQEKGAAILFSTHITADLEKCADRILYIRNGRIEADAGRRALIESYRLVTLPPECQELAGLPFLIGHTRGKEGCTALIHTDDCGAWQKATDGNGVIQPADLDAIMVHLEKEGLQ